MAKRSRSALAGLAVLLLAGLAANAADAAAVPPSTSPPAETFAESVDVKVVNVDVYVTDKDGKRVQGLKKEDFEITEDGKPVTISNFYAVDAAEAPAPAASAASGGKAGAPAAPASAAAIPEAQQLYLALFVDERSLTGSARNRMLPALQSFVTGRLRPGDRVLVASFDSAMKILQAPTADSGAIAAALGGLSKTAARGTQRVVDRRRVLDEISLASSTGRNAAAEASRTYGDVRLLAQADYDEIHATISALGQFIGSLAGLPGRKAVLLVSGGLSQHPAEALYEAWQAKFGRFSAQVGASRFDAFRQDTRQLVEGLVERANANRVTFYTLAAPEDLSGLTADNPGNNLLPPGSAAIESINQTQPLQTLAGATGGLAAVDKTGFFLDHLRADLDSYYSLGYVPTHREDGQKHKLAVRVRDRSLTVRVREGYRARTIQEVTASRTLSALLLGEANNPLGVSLAIEDEKPHGKKEYEVSLVVKLPLSKVVLVPKGGSHEGRVRIYVGARDTEGRLSQITEIAVPLSLSDEQLQDPARQTVGTRVPLLLRPGRHTLAVGVHDDVGNSDSTVTGLYTAGRLTKGGTGGSR